MSDVGHKGCNNEINTVALVASIELPVDVLDSTCTTKPLSANQGRVLNNTINAEVGARTSEVAAVKSRTSSLESDNTTNKSNISSLQSRIAALESDVATLQSEVATLESTLASIPISVFGEMSEIVPESAEISLAHIPLTGSLQLYFNGEFSTNYTLVGTTITFPEVLLVDDVISVYYDYSRP